MAPTSGSLCPSWLQRAREDNSAKISYPRAKNLTDNARASIHEGRLPEAFGGADRGRWSRQGATRTPASRQPKLSGPGARARASGRFGAMRAPSGCPPPARSGDLQSGGEASAPEREGSLKSNDHRGRRRIRLQTPRAGRRRNGGLAARPNRAMSDREMSSRLRLARGASPRVLTRPRRPAPPSLFAALSIANLGRETRREKGSACPIIRRFKRCDARASSSITLPWRGRVGEHEAKRNASRGGVNLIPRSHPTPTLASLVSTLPLQGRVSRSTRHAARLRQRGLWPSDSVAFSARKCV
jgi:hypothetical protein